MPPAFVIAAALSTAASGALTALAAGTVFAFNWVAFAGSVVLGGISRALAKEPSQPSNSLDFNAQNRTVTVKQPAAPWVVVFGEVRVGGIITFMLSSGYAAHNQALSLVITLSGHELQSIDGLYLSDEYVPLVQSDSGVSETAGVQWRCTEGKYAGRVWMFKHLGTADQAADKDLISRSHNTYPDLDAGGWTANHRQRGRGYIHLLLLKADSLFPNGIPNATVVLRGYKGVYDPRTATTGWSNNPALLVSAYLTNTEWGMGCIYADEIDETALIAAANVCDERVSAVYEPEWTVTAGSPSEGAISFAADQLQIQTEEPVVLASTGSLPMTPTGRLSTGAIYYFIRTGNRSGKLATSAANARAGTAIDLISAGSGTHTIAARRIVIDTATDTGVLTMETAEKRIFTGDGVRFSVIGGSPGYLPGGSPGGLSAGVTYYAIRVTDTTYKVATSYANALAGTGIELSVRGLGTLAMQLYDTPRYTANGSFSTDSEPQSVIEKLLSSMAGKAINTGGKWRILAGAYTAPTITLTPSEISGPVEIEVLASRADGANGVKGIFVSPENSWQPTDFPPVSSATYLSADSNERNWKDIELPFTTRTSMARRLALIELNRIRQSLVFKAPFMLSAYRCQVGDVVAFTWDKYGWSAKTFEVLEGNFAIREDATLGYDLVLRETAAAVFTWTAADSGELDIAPNTSLPTPDAMRNAVPPRVSGLELFGASNGSTVFGGRDAKFVWRKSTIFGQEVGGEIAGAGSLGRDEYFKDFEVKIFLQSGSPGVDWNLVRTDYVLDPQYQYTFEKNAEDNGGTSSRTFKIEVRQRSLYGKISELAAQLTVSNTAPTITTLTAVPADYSVVFSYPKPTDLDWTGLRLYLSTSNGFTPSSSNLEYDGIDTAFVINGLTPSTTYYYVYALSDAFGYGATSVQASFTTTADTAAADAATAQATADLKTRNVLTISASQPGTATDGDLWYRSSTYTWYVYGGSPSEWTVASDVTAQKTAAAITGQGALATLSTVAAAQIDSDAVTTIKISDGNVTTVKIDDEAATKLVSASTNGQLSHEAYAEGSPADNRNSYCMVLESLFFTLDATYPGTPIVTAQVDYARGSDGQAAVTKQFGVAAMSYTGSGTVLTGVTFTYGFDGVTQTLRLTRAGGGFSALSGSTITWFIGEGYPLMISGPGDYVSDTVFTAVCYDLGSYGAIGSSTYKGIPNGGPITADVTAYVGAAYIKFPEMLRAISTESGKGLSISIIGNGSGSGWGGPNVALFLMGPDNSGVASIGVAQTYEHRHLSALFSKR